MLSADLMLSGSVFHRVCAATEKGRVPAFVLTLGTTSTFELDDRSRLCGPAGMNNEGTYEGYNSDCMIINDYCTCYMNTS